MMRLTLQKKSFADITLKIISQLFSHYSNAIETHAYVSFDQKTNERFFNIRNHISKDYTLPKVVIFTYV